MKSIELPVPLLGAVAVTRGMLGLGAGLLLADSLPWDQRRAAGWTLVAIGVLSTLPLAANVLARWRN
jgi:hypothetical protein